MQFKDHRFRNNPPKSYDIVLQLSIEEVDDLLFDIEVHYPNIAESCSVKQLYKVLRREQETRDSRKENPGSYGSAEYENRLEREMWDIP